MISEQILLLLKRFSVSLLITVVNLAFLISSVRASAIIAVLHAKAPASQYVWLAERWSDSYKPLRNALGHAGLTDPNAPFVQRGIIERMTLALPNWIVSFALGQTEPLWMPAKINQVIPAQGIQPSENQTEAYAPPANQASYAPQTQTAAPSETAYATQDRHASPTAHTYTPESEPAVATRPTAAPIPAATQTAAPYDPDALWAAIKVPDAPIYKESDGVRIEKVPAGSVFDIVEERTTSQGVVYAGTVHSPKGRFEHVIVRRQDLQIFEGKRLTNTTREEREQASNYARVLAAIAEREDELKEQHNSRNPHHQPYHDALRRYQTFRQEAQKLQNGYTDSTGSARMEAGNRLRELKLEMSSLTPIVRDLQEKRDAWNTANQSNTSFNPEQDAQIMALRQQLDSMDLPD